MAFTIPTTFTNGTIANATEVNSNFAAVGSELNGYTNNGNILRAVDKMTHYLTISGDQWNNDSSQKAIGSIFISGGIVSNGILIIACGEVYGSDQHTIRLYTGSSPNYASGNTLRYSTGANAGGAFTQSFSFQQALTTELNFSSGNYIQITGQNQTAFNPNYTQLNRLTVLRF